MTNPTPFTTLRGRAAVWLTAAGLMAAVAVSPLWAQDVQPGIDIWTTPGGGTTFQEAAIPADFFDPGSDPLAGRIEFEGVPLPTLVGPPFSPTDTIVERLAPAVLPGPGTQDTIPIEIVALSLQSAQPITVTYSGVNPELWDVQVCLSDSGQQQGTMTIRKEHNNGGTFDSTLPVTPKLIFVRQNDGAVRPLDPAPQIDFQATDGRWVHNPDPGRKVGKSGKSGRKVGDRLRLFADASSGP